MFEALVTFLLAWKRLWFCARPHFSAFPALDTPVGPMDLDWDFVGSPAKKARRNPAVALVKKPPSAGSSTLSTLRRPAAAAPMSSTVRRRPAAAVDPTTQRPKVATGCCCTGLGADELALESIGVNAAPVFMFEQKVHLREHLAANFPDCDVILDDASSAPFTRRAPFAHCIADELRQTPDQRYLKRVQPWAFALENVPGLVNIRAECVAWILKQLENIKGHNNQPLRDVRWQILRTPKKVANGQPAATANRQRKQVKLFYQTCDSPKIISKRGVAVDAGSSALNHRANMMPCSTASRGASSGFWSASRRRKAAVDEMARAQGTGPGRVRSTGSDRQFGHALGNAMSQNVLERLFAQLLPSAGLANQGQLLDRPGSASSSERRGRASGGQLLAASVAPGDRQGSNATSRNAAPDESDVVFSSWRGSLDTASPASRKPPGSTAAAGSAAAAGSRLGRRRVRRVRASAQPSNSRPNAIITSSLGASASVTRPQRRGHGEGQGQARGAGDGGDSAPRRMGVHRRADGRSDERGSTGGRESPSSLATSSHRDGRAGQGPAALLAPGAAAPRRAAALAPAAAHLAACLGAGRAGAVEEGVLVVRPQKGEPLFSFELPTGGEFTPGRPRGDPTQQGPLALYNSAKGASIVCRPPTEPGFVRMRSPIQTTAHHRIYLQRMAVSSA
ncbi:unnamed protein product [Prorocentrum cordatum]|uniref:DNA (cytosine-5-)-methyltransferase n=1 Tax=Prorocentrum cordatum TaxID=2364126 RepID=A0ABN9VQE4_9DINO|nr:unnamed protein product [Polarella glacialis]